MQQLIATASREMERLVVDNRPEDSSRQMRLHGGREMLGKVAQLDQIWWYKVQPGGVVP